MIGSTRTPTQYKLLRITLRNMNYHYKHPGGRLHSTLPFINRDSFFFFFFFFFYLLYVPQRLTLNQMNHYYKYPRGETTTTTSNYNTPTPFPVFFLSLFFVNPNTQSH